MVRGCEKRVVRLQKPDSRWFDEVFFVLKDDPAVAFSAAGDIVTEANRLLEEVAVQRPRRRRGRLPVLPFLCGAALSAVALLPFVL